MPWNLDVPPVAPYSPSDTMAEFVLHPQLKQDCVEIDSDRQFTLLLANDARYPWVILVPRVADVRESYELSDVMQLALMQQSARLARNLMQLFDGDKCNVAALGNLVPQLHVHHVVRKQGDDAWPSPIWGYGTARPYNAAEQEHRLSQLRQHLQFCNADA